MGEKEQTPSGLGKLNFATADDKNMEHLQEVKLKCTSGQLTYLEADEPKEKDSTRDCGRGFEITGSALIKEPSDTLRDLLDSDKMDITFTQFLGCLPRKMKKAHYSTYRRMTKWKRKVEAYIRHNTLHMPNAKVVITEEQRDILAATIHAEVKGNAAVIAEVSEQQLRDGIQRYTNKQRLKRNNENN